MAKINYKKLYTLRADGRYMGFWRELGRDGKPTGKRHAIYDKNPEQLFRRIAEKEKPVETTLKSVAESWEKKRREQVGVKTWKNYAPHCREIVEQYGSRDIEDITPQEINADLLSAKAKQFSRTVVNTRRVVWNGIFEHAVADFGLRYNPALMVKLPRGLPKSTRRAPTDDEIRIVLASRNLDFGFFPFLLLCSGMRKSEALALHRSDVDLKNKMIRVEHNLDYAVHAHPVLKGTKTERSTRTIPIIGMLEEPLRAHLKRTRGDLLFPPRPSNRVPKPVGYMSEHQYETLWAKYAQSSGLAAEGGNDPITAHNLRHGTATLLFEAGVDPYTAAAILGHSDIKVTLGIYTELRKKQKAKSIKKFDKKMSTLEGRSKKGD